MSEPKVRASASVQVTVEVKADGVWGDDCTLAQVHKQARADIEMQLRQVQDALRQGNMPSDLCKCACGKEGGTEDHEDGCLWRAAMCELCSGTGHCPSCWGDGYAEEGGCKVASHA